MSLSMLRVFFPLFRPKSKQDGEAIAELHLQDEKHVPHIVLDAPETSASSSLSRPLQKCSGQQSAIDTLYQSLSEEILTVHTI